MPSKGRQNPCSNILNRGSGHKKYSEVRDCNEAFLQNAREWLPEYNWSDGTRLCGTCRGDVYRKISKRKGVREPLEQARSQLRKPGKDGEEAEHSTVSGEEGEPMELDNARMGDGEHGEPPRIYLNLPPSTSRQFEPGPSTSSFLIPSAPNLSGNTSQPAPQSPNRSPFHAFPMSSPSATPSNQSGSTYHDEQSARDNFHEMLSKLGILVPMKKPKGKEWSELFGKCKHSVQNIFKEYAGGKLPTSSTPCACGHCKLIIERVKALLPSVPSKREKYIMLTTLPKEMTIQKMMDKLHITSYLARNVSALRNQQGPFSFPTWKSTGTPIQSEDVMLVLNFYIDDSNSRPSPNARDTVNVRKGDGTVQREPKRIMLSNLRETYKNFKELNRQCTIKISKFAELRPRNCCWPGQTGFHNTCTCIIHGNFFLALEGLKSESIEAIKQRSEENPLVPYESLFDKYEEFIAYLLCNNPTEDCYLGYCEDCPNEERLADIFSLSDGLDITYKTWEKNDIVTKMESHEEFYVNFQVAFKKFLTHHFIYRKQKDYIQSIKSGPLENGTTAVLTVDFGENYSFVVQDAVAGFHWNNRQSTIHPFVLYVAGVTPGIPCYKTYFVISDEMTHDASTFHAFRNAVIHKIMADYPKLETIVYVSDGAASQYKNFKNIGNLAFHEVDYGLKARWIFTATSHGKSTCDAMSAVIKRSIRLQSLSSKDPITTPEKMFEVAQNSS